MLSPQQMDSFIDQHFGFEAADNIDGVLSTLSTDAVHDIVGFPAGPTHGRDNARPFYESLFADLAEGQATSIKRYYGENFLVDESLWKGTAPGAPFGLKGGGRPLQFRLLHLIEFNEQGQIRKEQVWIDLAAIIKQLPQP